MMRLKGNDLLIRNGPGAPASIAIVLGSPQSANCGTAFATPLVAVVRDAGGTPIPNISVVFTAPASSASGTFASTGTRTETRVTGPTGQATSSTFTANTVSGANYTITAMTGALTANFTMTNVETWINYIPNVINPLTTVEAWWRMRDTSGVTVVNSGALGSAVDLTAIAWTMAQAGQLGAGEAGSTDSSTTRLQCANNATLANLTKFEWVFLVKPSGAGESNTGRFWSWGNLSDKVGLGTFFGATTVLVFYLFNTAGTQFVAQTNAGIGTTAFSLLFFAYDDAGDRKGHIYKGVSGAVSELTYAAQTAVTGTLQTTATLPLNLMNDSAQAGTFAGLCDEIFIVNGNLTAAQRTQLTVLAGV